MSLFKVLGRRPRMTRVALIIGLIASAAVAVPSAARTPTATTPTPASTAAPQLTANTNAGCNAPQPKGFARCFAVVRTPSNHQITPDADAPPSTALGPADIQDAYKLPAAAGGGQTVAIVDAFGYSTAEDDLAVFRSQFGLPPCTTANGCFRKVDQRGGTNYPADDPGWATETALDLDAVSSACPKCNLLLVEGDSSLVSDLAAAVDTAVSLGAKYVSNSYGAKEFGPETTVDQHYDHQGVAVVAATGDTGNIVSWPAANPNVVAAGGTRLTRDSSTPRGWQETAWADGGSGCSMFEPQPDYQLNIGTNCDKRAIADIAADADPATGLAVYDTIPFPFQGPPGWIQVGGTSLSSPLLTAMFALAGTPQLDTYPVTYPYHDANQSSDLFDITEGTDGTCGNVLCNAGPGWDGPTGLGTPHGVASLSSGPHGELTGRVTDADTGEPVPGATVTATPTNNATRTGVDGSFQLSLPPDSYDLKVTDFGYRSTTQNGVQVSDGQITTVNFAITAAPAGALSGAVTDGSGHGWPLHASITIPGYPNGPVWTDPVTGKYSVALPQGDYTVTVSADYPGYPDRQVPITVGADTSRDIALPADLTACIAPGYGPTGSEEDFTDWTGGTPRDGWSVTGSKSGWRFDNPGDRSPALPPDVPLGGDDAFAIADSGYTGDRIDSTLTSPVVDLSGQPGPRVQFDTAYYAAQGQTATVEVSADGGKTWTSIWHQAGSNATGHVSVSLAHASDQERVRFHYTGRDGWYWAVDSVQFGTPTCGPLPGGLLTGVVTDQASGQPVNGAQISGPITPQPQGWPSGLAQATSDPAIPGGFYWLFTLAGSHQFTATAADYTTATATVDVAANTVTRHDWTLTKAGR